MRRPIAWWLLATILIGVIAVWYLLSDNDYRAILRTLSGGVLTTLYVTLVAFGLAVVLALVIATMRNSVHRVLREFATFYTEIVRGVPVLVFLFYIAFVGAPWLVSIINWAGSLLYAFDLAKPLTVRDLDFTWRAIIALCISYSAFVAEVFRAGIEAVDRGQVEAAEALGLKKWRIFRHIVAPQAIKTILPPLGNDFVAMIKDSALVSALGVQDITQIGKVYSSGTFKFFETYNVVAFLYLVMTISLSLLVRALEVRLKRSERQQ